MTKEEIKKVEDDKHRPIRVEDHRGLEGLEYEPISLWAAPMLGPPNVWDSSYEDSNVS